MTAFFKEIEPFRGNGNENEKGQTLEEFLEEYDPYKYKNPCVTTDAVIFLQKKGSGRRMESSDGEKAESSEHWLVGVAGWVY